MVFVVDSESGTLTAFSLDVLESSDTDAGQSGQIELLIFSTGRSAHSQLSIVVVGRGTVGADSLDEVEGGETGADSSHDFFIDSALNVGDGVNWRRNENLAAFSLVQKVALNTVT